ncbi:hypothetical protein F9C07_4128 [Aspergillus flavus]|uniref:Uncharacterized protein n=1 Tax=Aspergillus flavus (strain ATCC 200026 / FGSC A1120 / IAM 13836 / NRRL 3357 / JCM 12722 / SRRC 167) TaxID=332952 RepID=A0A7U2QZ79_ASPFN|nr:hypothetical protein F9C07_4128 [Aspergillus flavus]
MTHLLGEKTNRTEPVDPTWNLPKLRKNTFRVFAGNSSTDLPLVLLKNAI